MPDYINVPVRRDLVDEVTRFIADRLAVLDKKTHAGPAGRVEQGAVVTEESREWSVEDLQLIRDNEGAAKSVKLFAEVLDVLAAAHPRPLSKEAIADVTGVEPLSMQKAFGRVTVWIHNRTKDKRWPIYWVGGDWAMSDNNAALWKSIS